MMELSDHCKITHNSPEDPPTPYCHRKRNNNNEKVKKSNHLSPISSFSFASSSSSCFFCTMDEPDPSLRRAGLAKCFKEIPLSDDPDHVLVLSFLWSAAMSHPDDPEFPSLGLFDCLVKLIRRGLTDGSWLLKDQNIYIPYYASHVLGSYAMNKAQLAEKVMKSGAVQPLVEMMRGRLSWVEQRVAVRVLGHLASHDASFQAITSLELHIEIVQLAMGIASRCLEVIYSEFICINESKRLKYQCNLLTRGLGGAEVENRKAEEWAMQLQSWSLYLLNCFAKKEICLDLMCTNYFLKELCAMWGGLAHSPQLSCGTRLIRTLCRTKFGRKRIADSKEFIYFLCNLSRSSDDCQVIAIDALLNLLRDLDTRYKIIDIATVYLVDLVEMEGLGDVITQVLLQDYHMVRYGNLKLGTEAARGALAEAWEVKVERRKEERLMTEDEVTKRKYIVRSLRKEANRHFRSGEIEKATEHYTKALDHCTLRMTRERVVIYSNRAQCHLVMRHAESAIRDATRAVALSGAAGMHGRSLWRRSQAYDMVGLERQSLMDCLMFINQRVRSEGGEEKIPYYAARMLNKQMNATWVFARARAKAGVSESQVDFGANKARNGTFLDLLVFSIHFP
ncbi:hypothetical protein CDL15_Pgr001696 [Punica granatum]|uniref:ARM repeat N-terminal plant domain-containing protein n=2 Tax=Punica granatum TaxID=22663 RepID=A0A218XCM8_PUNGR|nr:hypothetical protein CDL15_Pgr001696 [Punica granatum]